MSDPQYVIPSAAVPREEPSPDPRFSHNISLIALAQGGDKTAMEKLVVDNMGLVRTVAAKFRDRGTEFEDLMQIGTLGMIKAIHSFDTTRGTAFSTYAVPLIVGEIRRHLRDDGLIRVSRGTRHTGMLLMRERARIAAEEGREATVSELAAAVGIGVEDAAMALEAMTPVSSLSDNAFGEDSPELGAVIPDRADADEMARQMDRIALAQVIEQLPPMWKKIILLRYYRDMTQQQVADLLGLTQVKVSREEKKIMAFMRERLS
jgi:RNA polymerase sporulation-specific sigma factor